MFTIRHEHVIMFQDPKILEYLHKLSHEQQLIIFKIDKLMKITQEKFDEIVGDLDQISNDIATDYAQLMAEAQAGEVSEESVAKAEANIAKLKALGASVENPVPTGDTGSGDTGNPLP